MRSSLLLGTARCRRSGGCSCPSGAGAPATMAVGGTRVRRGSRPNVSDGVDAGTFSCRGQRVTLVLTSSTVRTVMNLEPGHRRTVPGE